MICQIMTLPLKDLHGDDCPLWVADLYGRVRDPFLLEVRLEAREDVDGRGIGPDVDVSGEERLGA